MRQAETPAMSAGSSSFYALLPLVSELIELLITIVDQVSTFKLNYAAGVRHSVDKTIRERPVMGSNPIDGSEQQNFEVPVLGVFFIRIRQKCDRAHPR